jgi:hypothetical protein
MVILDVVAKARRPSGVIDLKEFVRDNGRDAGTGDQERPAPIGVRHDLGVDHHQRHYAHCTELSLEMLLLNVSP